MEAQSGNLDLILFVINFYKLFLNFNKKFYNELRKENILLSKIKIKYTRKRETERERKKWSYLE